MRDLSVLSGKQLWVWQLKDLSGGVLGVINDAKALGMCGLKVKCADGNEVWPQFRQMVQPCKDAGLTLSAWMYCYGKDIEGEAKAAIAALDAGAASLCLDVELDYVGSPADIAKMGQLIRTAHPDVVITFAPWCFPNSGPWAKIPYAEFAKWTDAVEPQQYWSDYAPTCDVGLRESDAQLKPWGLPIYPIGQAYAGTSYTPIAGDYTLFEQTCHALGYKGVSFWRAGSMDDTMKACIKAMNFPLVAPSPKLDPTAAEEVVELLQAAYTLTDDAQVHDAEHFAADALRDAAGLPKGGN